MSPTRTRRVHGALLAALLCASQAGAWLHEAVVSHITCLEHGESVHAVVPAALPARAPAQGLDLLAGQKAGGDEHEHCGSSALLRWGDVALVAPAAIGQLPRPPSSLPADAGSRSAIPGGGVYLVAPKTSPPSLA